MMRDGMPGVLRERLGEAASEGLIQFLSAREDYMTEAIAEAVAHTLEPRFAAIDSRFAQIDGRLDNIDRHFEKIDSRFAQIDSRFENIDRHFEKVDSRFANIDRHFEKIDGRLENIGTHFEYGDRRLDQFDGRLSRIETGATAFEVRINTKLDAQFLAVDAKLSRTMHVQAASLTLFAAFAGGLYLAFIGKL